MKYNSKGAHTRTAQKGDDIINSLNQELSDHMQFAPYDQPILGKSIWQLINTFVPFGICWAAAYFSLAIHWALALVISVLTGFLLLRIFIIFHDCCHRSFFKRRAANEWVGFITGVLTFTPYEQWKNTHATHHATSGNLDKRGTGDIWTVTLREFSAMPRWKKLLYSVYRNPLTMFIIGPIYIFLLDYRVNRKQASLKERWNTYLTNVGIVLLLTALCLLFGWKAVLLVQLPMFMISGMTGIWLFYVQHQFEQSYYEVSDAWSYQQAALQGSSFFHLPKWLHWLTGNIGYHHIHHLNPRVPNYHLPLLFGKHAALRDVPTITLKNSVATLRLRFWDEQAKKMVGWREWRMWKRTFNL